MTNDRELEFHPIRTTAAALAEYAALFAVTFPHATHLDARYLEWLYAKSPRGEAVGFDARVGDRTVAHYVCVPAEVQIRGETRRALLSLNTATHPEFQGKGLFTKLAKRTYEAGQAQGFDFVYGVANANSTHGMKKLGFEVVDQLDARVGVGELGRFDGSVLERLAAFRRVWSPEELAWRLESPAFPVRAVALAGGRGTGFTTPTMYPGVDAWAELAEQMPSAAPAPLVSRPRVFLGKVPRGAGRISLRYPSIPKRLRPRPLNMVARDLRDGSSLDRDAILFTFLDFDAF